MGKAILIYLTFLIPFTIIAIIIWGLFRKKYIIKFIGIVWAIFTFLIILAIIVGKIMQPIIIKKSDIYGEYVIDRTKFKGRQADWQYENFRFKITENDELIFESRIYDNKWKSEKVKVSYSSGYYDDDKKDYCNQKIRLYSDSTNHHIIQDNPTLFRKSFGFYYVFRSEKFGNVFFKKKKEEGIF